MENNTNVKDIKTVGIKSKNRVRDFGEVFTPEHIVKDMIDIIPMDGDAKIDLDKTWLEPACGTGNFLVEILARRLALVDQLEEQNRLRNTFIALSGIYAIDIQKDNVEESKARLFEILCQWYLNRTGEDINADRKLKKLFEHVLDKNIIWGNGLTMRIKEGLEPCNELTEGHDYILVTEWNMDGDTLTKKDYPLCTMLEVPGGTVFNEYEPVHFLKAPKAKMTIDGSDSDKLYD